MNKLWKVVVGFPQELRREFETLEEAVEYKSRLLHHKGVDADIFAPNWEPVPQDAIADAARTLMARHQRAIEKLQDEAFWSESALEAKAENDRLNDEFLDEITSEAEQIQEDMEAEFAAEAERLAEEDEDIRVGNAQLANLTRTTSQPANPAPQKRWTRTPGG